MNTAEHEERARLETVKTALRNLLNVACTRAMHRLTLTGVGEPTPFVRM